MVHSQNNVFFGGLIIAIGLAVCLFGYYDLQKTQVLFKNGHRAQAIVTRIDYLGRTLESKVPEYIPVIKWQDKNGKITEVRANFSSPKESTFRKGQAFTVFYNPKNPSREYYVLKNGNQPKARITDYIMLIIGAVIMLLGALKLFGIKKNSS